MSTLDVDKLNKLVNEFKTSNDRKIVDQIFILLDSTLQQKAKYVYFVQKFVKTKFLVEEYDEHTEQTSQKEKVKFFTLRDISGLDFNDILQDLRLEVVRLVQNFDNRSVFSNYLFATLKHWRPSYIKQQNFLGQIATIKESELGTQEQNRTLDNLVIDDSPHLKLDLDSLNLSNAERRVLNVLTQNSELNTTQIAERLGVTKQAVSLILIKLRKKIKINLDKN